MHLANREGNPECGFGCKGYQERVGVLLAQLGTPDAPTPSALKRYLKQFLSDRRVIEVNRLLWWVILNGIILNTRPKRSAKLYARVWTDEGSPLLRITRAQAEGLQAQLSSQGISIPVTFGMRYGNPSIEKGCDELIAQGCTRLIIVPMYPQYAAATTASTYDAVFSHLLKRRWVPSIRIVPPFFRHSGYINSVAELIESAYKDIPAEKRPQRLIVSYHGVPKEYVDRGDPYCCMCTETTARLVSRLSIKPSEIIQTYQSRFGSAPWLTPYTDKTIEALGDEGIKRIAVVCPGFTADCLETIDEIGTEARHLFKEHGGEELTLIPCINSSASWIKGLTDIVKEEIGNWTVPLGSGCVRCPSATLVKS